MKIRQPILTVAGHVDHGKTSILDALRRSAIAEKEAGHITQKISFTDFPAQNLRMRCPLIDKYDIKLEIPGFLFIDTPGHAAFNNLRKRGGSLADLAILVIDINEGIKPQTAEVIQILKSNKTPFIVALNKIDKIQGWHKIKDEFKDNYNAQPIHVRQAFDEKYYTLIGALHDFGFNAELYFKITNFSKDLVVVPCSAKTGEGISEILMMICGLSQKFLREQLVLGDKAKGVVLEIKKEKTMNYIEAVLYDGSLSIGQEIAIAKFDGYFTSKIKSIQVIEPLSFKFRNCDSVKAAAGIRIQLADKLEILPGMPFMSYTNEKEVKDFFKKDVGESIKTDKQGIIIKADSLGSLEALIVLLKQANVNVVRAGIGSINKSDILDAKTNLDINPIDAVILGFNVDVDDVVIQDKIKIITDKVVYKLIENLKLFREEKSREIEKERLMSLSKVCKLEILHSYVFRNTNPAIFGVRVVAGSLVNGQEFIDENNEKIGRIKNIQSENKRVEEATEGMEVAVSIPGINFERKLKDKKYLYSEISLRQFKTFKDNKDLLSNSELSALQEVKNIKQSNDKSWED
ncbi:translation initiation factor IF-2 [Candidatus Pacearchaeota archaeon]|nr:translation initiation factor IF-2 [Candidatus Pacearchaeota archaeon]